MSLGANWSPVLDCQSLPAFCKVPVLLTKGDPYPISRNNEAASSRALLFPFRGIGGGYPITQKGESDSRGSG